MPVQCENCKFIDYNGDTEYSQMVEGYVRYNCKAPNNTSHKTPWLYTLDNIPDCIVCEDYKEESKNNEN